MLNCTACIRRCIRIIFVDVLDTRQPLTFYRHTHPIRRTLRLRQQSAWTPHRAYATDAFYSPDIETLPAELIPSSSSAPIKYHTAPSTLRNGERPGEEERPGPEQYKAADLEKELYWVRDPLKLAVKIVNLLKRGSKDDYEKALALVRLASKSMPCTVSWNHLVDYNMSKGRVKAAVGTYNEVCTISSTFTEVEVHVSL